LLKVREKHIPFITNSMTNTIQLSEDIVLLSQDSILTSKNDDVNIINSIVMRQFAGEAVEYLSANTIIEQNKTDYQYPIEFLNSLIVE
ncbi:31941_t:CDS:2, partial [Racocetra persica]